MKQYPVYFQPLSNGETLAYRKCGNGGKNLVLIHGNMSSSVHFQILLEQLESEYTIYAVDLRGFGDSTYNHPFRSLKELAEDVKEFLDLQKIEKTALLGWSAGGGVAMELSIALGSRITRLFLLSAMSVAGFPLFRKDEKNAPIPGDFLKTWEEIAADPVQVAPPQKALEDGNREFFRYIYNLVIYQTKQPSPEDYEIYLDAIMKERCLLDLDYSLVHFNISDTFNGAEQGSGAGHRITAPITIIQGEKDITVLPEVAKGNKEFFGDQAELVMVPGAGHSVVTDNTAGLADIIRKRA